MHLIQVSTVSAPDWVPPEDTEPLDGQPADDDEALWPPDGWQDRPLDQLSIPAPVLQSWLLGNLTADRYRLVFNTLVAHAVTLREAPDRVRAPLLVG